MLKESSICPSAVFSVHMVCASASITLYFCIPPSFEDIYLKCHSCHMWHFIHAYQHIFLCLCVFVCQVYVLHPPLGDKPLQQSSTLQTHCNSACDACVLERELHCSTIPADSAGIRSGFSCQQQPPSTTPASSPLLSPELLDEGERDNPMAQHFLCACVLWVIRIFVCL